MSDTNNSTPKTSYLIAYDIQRVLPGGHRYSICLHGPLLPGGFGRLADAQKIRDALQKAFQDAGTAGLLEIVPLAVSEDYANEILSLSADGQDSEESDQTADYLRLPELKFS